MTTPQPNSAHRYDRVRRQHALELAQDYVEAIHKLVEKGQTPRVTDLQEIFGVSHVSIIRGLRRLADQGLVHYSKETGIELSNTGKKMAVQSAEQHELLVKFLKQIGVSTNQAEADAEGAEHHLSKETYQAIRRFLKQV